MSETLRALTAQFAMFEALLLVASAAHKGLRGAHLRSVARQFAGVPGPLAASALVGAAAGELAAGVLLAVPAERSLGAALAVLIWAGYLGLIVRAIAQGRRGDCGCSFGSMQRPLGRYHAARNALLLAAAVMVAFGSATGTEQPPQGSQVLAACALLALYAALDQVMGLPPLRRGEIV